MADFAAGRAGDEPGGNKPHRTSDGTLGIEEARAELTGAAPGALEADIAESLIIGSKDGDKGPVLNDHAASKSAQHSHAAINPTTASSRVPNFRGFRELCKKGTAAAAAAALKRAELAARIESVEISSGYRKRKQDQERRETMKRVQQRRDFSHTIYNPNGPPPIEPLMKPWDNAPFKLRGRILWSVDNQALIGDFAASADGPSVLVAEIGIDSGRNSGWPRPELAIDLSSELVLEGIASQVLDQWHANQIPAGRSDAFSAGQVIRYTPDLAPWQVGAQDRIKRESETGSPDEGEMRDESGINHFLICPLNDVTEEDHEHHSDFLELKKSITTASYWGSSSNLYFMHFTTMGGKICEPWLYDEAYVASKTGFLQYILPEMNANLTM